ncbi:DEAD-domain-containing protein [Hortaea werneckii]|nr:DEAD-domain-containing protein [Hortaea werneckii]
MRRTLQRCSTASIPLGAFRSHPSSTPRISSNLCLRHAVRQSLPRPFRHPSRTLHTSLRRQQQQQQQAAAQDATTQDAPANRITRFAELETHNVVHPNVVRTLTQQMGLETMTDVQQATINEALKGTDIIAQAKTGTGKTLAFLLPVLQNIINQDPSLAKRSFGRRGPRTTADDIRALIISPTRELAEQIATEAKKLLSNTGCIVQTAVGGTAKRAGLRAIQMQGCHILVGTPGRLKDIFSDASSRVQAPDLDALVFDEADRLLDQGFWPEIQEIMRLLPTPQEKDRQTMMFSATVPREVVDLVRSTLKPGFQFVKCVNEDEQPTHERVPQRIVQVQGFENKLPALAELVQRGIEASKQPGGRPFKAIVYYNSTAEVTLAAAALKALQPQTPPAQDAFGARRQPHPWAPLRIFDIHSKLSQAQRTAASDLFRRCESGILMSSDVTARGMDFPNVTHVIQMSVPPSKEQYIHRIGRTARAGKEGEGWILLSPEEAREARYRLSRIPLQADTSLQTASLDLTRPGNVPEAASTILEMLRGAMSRVPNEAKFDAYRALLGVYGWFNNKRRLVEAMNNLSSYGWALRDPPRISPLLAQRLGISRVPGVNTGSTSGPMEEGMDRRSFGGSRFGRQDSYNSRPSSRGSFGFGSDRRESRSPGRFGGMMDRSRGGRGRFNVRESSDDSF